VRRILEVNQHRFVRMSGALALAEIAHLSPDRQLEAEQLYQAFLREFDGQTEYEAQIIEQQAGAAARDRLKSMEFAPLGRPAPEIVGVDLEGQPLSLSAFQGQVVLLSFWATWCGPCMKLVPYERELLAQFAGRPLVILGINADEDPATALAAAQKKEMTWRSFRDRSTAGETISEQWAALFPTFYVIDHQGVIRQRFCGVLPPELLQETVGPLVSAAEAAAGAP
jgi:thiol-disulfide isomerase/thioredoxin